MKYEVIISEHAEKDLDETYEYIAFNLLSPLTAAEIIDRLEEVIFSLESMPYRFQQYDSEPWKSIGLRRIPVGNYIIFYIPDDNEQTVMVTRVIYGGRNLEEQSLL